MPTYIYTCTTCGHEFEAYQPYSHDTYTCCEKCGCDTLRKVYKPVHVIYKGGGFYVNDSRKESNL